jgi:Toastrack DUF4097
MAKGWRLLYLLVLPAGVVLAQGPLQLEKTIETTASPSVNLINLSGRVVVHGWSKSAVHAVWQGSSSQVELDTDAMPEKGQAHKVHLTTRLLHPQSGQPMAAADYDVQVPVGASVAIRNPQGSIQVEHLRGDASLESVGGSISVKDVDGMITARSVGGDIEIDHPTGPVEADTIMGSLRLVDSSSSNVKATTASGKIHYDGDFADGGKYILSSYSGDLDVVCPETASVEVTAKTLRGKLDKNVPLVPKSHNNYSGMSGQTFVGTQRAGYATVDIKSFSGNIHIHTDIK